MSGGDSGIICASAENTPFEDDFLDGALCECVLSLCANIDDALNEMHRIIKQNGRLIISDIYSKAGFEMTSGAMKYLYTKEQYGAFVSRRGFEIILFEDHSRELAKMAARMIMDGTDIEAVPPCLSDTRKLG